MVETPVVPEREIAIGIDRHISEILTEWSSSNDAITLPETVNYPSGFVLDKLDKRTAANAFKGAFESGDICFLVSTGNFEDNKLSDTSAKRPSSKEDGYAVFTFFPSNFLTKCQETGKPPKTVVQNAMIDALWRDAQLQVRKEKGEVTRTQSKVKGKVGILEKKK